MQDNPKNRSQVIASIQGVNKTFANKNALNNLSFEIKSHQVLAILGANGAGKTTLINTLLGRLQLDSGQVSIFGLPAGNTMVKRQSGAMLQVASLPETLKVKEHIQLFQSYYPYPMAYEKVVAYAGLESLQDRYPKKLSGGEKQRLIFALSICGNPKLLFLDEPSVGMDIEARHRLWKAIRDLKNLGTAIVLTTHHLEEADSLADEILVIKAGKIIQQGSNQQIKACVSATTIRFSGVETDTDFTGISDVLNTTISGKYISLQTVDVHQTLLQLLTEYPQLIDLTVSRAGLEDAFMQLNNSPLYQNKVNQGEAA